LRRLSTGNQIARRHGNLGYWLVNQSPLNAGSTHRDRTIKPVNLLDSRPQNALNQGRTHTASDKIP